MSQDPLATGVPQDPQAVPLGPQAHQPQVPQDQEWELPVPLGPLVTVAHKATLVPQVRQVQPQTQAPLALRAARATQAPQVRSDHRAYKGSEATQGHRVTLVPVARTAWSQVPRVTQAPQDQVVLVLLVPQVQPAQSQVPQDQLV